MSVNTEEEGKFADYDDEQVYNESQARALRESTRNFVVEFGKDGAQIAFNLCATDVEVLLDAPAPEDRPVRWINIWAPHRQVDVVDVLGKRYKFSPRLLAILRTDPPEPEVQKPDRHTLRSRARAYHKDDVEVGSLSIDLPRLKGPPRRRDNTSHYGLARQMINYQSVDIGSQFLCVGANWMYDLSRRPSEHNITTEGNQQRLWSWLVLCEDHTVLSFREYPGVVENAEDLKSMRANTLSVLSQLSKFGHDDADAISMQTVRQALDMNAAHSHPGVEGASNLFFYLFDDWRAVYATVGTFHKRLDDLQTEIFDDIKRKPNSTPKIEIIPRLHILGRQIRQMQHLYEGYKNLIRRILEGKSSVSFGTTMPRTFSGLSADFKGVVIAQSARQRFERLSDRIELLILSETQEFLAEKEALVSTYFNINAQKDSVATARLTRSATLLAKVSLLFLPVSLMTGYFSVQIQELQGVYTVKDYWYAFACLICISFLFLFFFSRLLMWTIESLDEWVIKAARRCKLFFVRRLIRKEAEKIQ